MQIEWSERAVSSCRRTVRRSAKDSPARWRVGRSAKRLLTARVEKQEDGVFSAAKRTRAERAEARDGFEFERVVSCGSGDLRWRTKLHLGSRKSLDDLHRSITLGRAPKIAGVIGGGGVWLGQRFLRRAEQVKAKRQECGAS